ncbi:hypothetical protein GCM10023238_22640 [Streptomyces heliomycini]
MSRTAAPAGDWVDCAIQHGSARQTDTNSPGFLATAQDRGSKPNATPLVPDRHGIAAQALGLVKIDPESGWSTRPTARREGPRPWPGAAAQLRAPRDTALLAAGVAR